MSRPGFRVVTIPQLSSTTTIDPPEIALAQKYRRFRLHALKSDAAAFGALFEDEEQRDLQYTLQRLTNPKAIHLIAINVAEQGDAWRDADSTTILLELPWHGMVVLLGPQGMDLPTTAKADPFGHMTADGDSLGPDLNFLLNGTFVDRRSRGLGLAKMLMHHALDLAGQQAVKQRKGVTCTILVDENNAAAYRLYLGSSFKVVSKEEYTKRLMVDGRLIEERWVAVTMRYYRGVEQLRGDQSADSSHRPLNDRPSLSQKT